MNQFTATYIMLLNTCLKMGVEEVNKRTGSKITMIPNGASFTLELSDGILPLMGLRLTRPHVAAAETAWCFLGHPTVDWLRKWTKTWDQFADIQKCANCDGEKNVYDPGNNGYSQCGVCLGAGKVFWLMQSYGWRWRGEFGIDQIECAVDRLKADKSDRRVWISSWDPGQDIVDTGQLTVPCPVGFTLSVIGGRLYSSLMIRSSDLYHGLPMDVMRHALVMAAFAATLEVQLGSMRVNLAHPHVYERQYEICREMIDRRQAVCSKIAIPNWNIQRIIGDSDFYVESFKKYCDTHVFSDFNPKSEVVP